MAVMAQPASAASSSPSIYQCLEETETKGVMRSYIKEKTILKRQSDTS